MTVEERMRSGPDLPATAHLRATNRAPFSHSVINKPRNSLNLVWAKSKCQEVHTKVQRCEPARIALACLGQRPPQNQASNHLAHKLARIKTRNWRTVLPKAQERCRRLCSSLPGRTIPDSCHRDSSERTRSVGTRAAHDRGRCWYADPVEAACVDTVGDGVADFGTVASG
jgi:hypothetical protein